ncbi:hypothetical protein [Mangrovibacterium diazotrophicum]|uniref:Uncharacterized protein n=1 Tax=Mangrovibacterium diazotrophicum TaxID=1261403 RepID=A0A419W414_9BACT|nr:hypothetical protein [Mangrovibacterium diazotrophicum]RKD90188.1 hypothetical protein BC643_0524 [Mangrovibacterium diazotrophicum]
MEKHEKIFEKIKELLIRLFPNELTEIEEENHISIGDTGIWIMSDSRELTVGYGLTHIHCDPKYDDLSEVVDLFFNLLTCKKQITKFYKGDFSYKHRTDLLLADNEIYNIGTAMTWLFPYWKKTTSKVQIEDEIIELDKIKKDIDEIKTLHNNV